MVSKSAGEWETYDIVFRAARFEGDKKTENAGISVRPNGELIHDDCAFENKTGAGKKEGPQALPIKLQGHHNPVKFRNLWIQRLKLEAAEEKAEAPKKKKKATRMLFRSMKSCRRRLCRQLYGLSWAGRERPRVVGATSGRDGMGDGISKKFAAILLRGLMGPIRVKGETYTPAATMAGLRAALG